MLRSRANFGRRRVEGRGGLFDNRLEDRVCEFAET